ncbi:MAG: penicillin-binding protein [Crocinitomicaceae bacterium]|nr:penicillin-binding protein [Crocinitomicaceae bacterium]|tara:strand:+ start:7184 stop:9529 length:2346 start_codon:yes stop_codon:yes gene_type:complete
MSEKKQVKKKKYRKQVLILWLLLLVPIGLFWLLMVGISNDLLGELPTFEDLENPKSNLATEVYTADGRLLGKYFKENRSNAEFNNISPHVINALVATEDERYNEHSGIDLRGLIRAIAYGGTNGGASTITQQLAKMLFTEVRSKNIVEAIIQKLKEWVIAVRLERQYTKSEILTMYLNKFDFINNAVGIKSASQVYFNKLPDSLNLLESAVLVGMAKNPSRYNPRRFPERSLNRRNTVLMQLVRNEYLTQAEYDSLKEIPIVLDYQKVDHTLGRAAYFREVLRAYLHKITKEKDEDGNYILAKPDGKKYDIYRDGLKIFTTIDSRMQEYAEYGVSQHLGTELQADFWRHIKRKKNTPFANDISKARVDRILNAAMKRSALYYELKQSGMSQDSIKLVFNTPVATKVFTWKGEKDTVLSPYEKLRYNKCFLQTGMMSINPHNGYIKAWVGGINHKHFSYDHVKQAKRQIGSTIKPFVYAMAVTDKGISPCYKVPNHPYTFEKGQYGLLKDWTPHNPGREYGGEVSLAYGLANSLNTITAWVMKQVTPQAVVSFIRKAGINSEMDPVPSLCLGVPDVSLFEMVGAYASFANKGQWLEPIFVTRILDKEGNEIFNNLTNRKSNTVLSEEDAYVMLQLLKGTVNGVRGGLEGKRTGTAMRLRFSKDIRPYGGIPRNIEIAAKTGTTQDQADGWFIGITPDLVSGVWVGGEDRDIRFSNLSKGSGTNMALPVWGYYMNKVYADSSLAISKGKFEKPPGPLPVETNCEKAAQRKNPWGEGSENDFGL